MLDGTTEPTRKTNNAIYTFRKSSLVRTLYKVERHIYSNCIITGKLSSAEALLLLMPTILNPASGSANPATSLSSLWAYMEPALDHIVKSPSNDTNGKAPAIDYGLYAGIHSACYN